MTLRLFLLFWKKPVFLRPFHREAGTFHREAGTFHREVGTFHREAGTFHREAGTFQREASTFHREAGTFHRKAGTEVSSHPKIGFLSEFGLFGENCPKVFRTSVTFCIGCNN